MSRPVPPPASLPEHPSFRRDSKYQRPRRFISWSGLILGLVLGLAGGMYISQVLFPVVETSTRPDQLRIEDRNHYAVAIALSYAYDSNLSLAVERMFQLDLGNDPIQETANIACNLARSGYIDSNAGLRGVRALRTFYQLQGREGCADDIIPDNTQPQVIEVTVPTSTPTFPPPPTKTPSADDTTPTPSNIVFVPTTPPQRTFEGGVTTFCDTILSGIIEVYVVQRGTAVGIPGEPVQVRWDTGTDVFYTGLKPERGLGYADFQMEEGESYIVSMPERSDPLRNALTASPCTTENLQQAITSYRVTFIRN